jgi:hypothetical protein
MKKETEYENIQAFWDETSNRLFAYSEKNSQVGISKAGLSVTDI